MYTFSIAGYIVYRMYTNFLGVTLSFIDLENP